MVDEFDGIMKQTRAGFTLVELLVSLSIIAVLTAIGIASFSTASKQSRDTKRKSDLQQIRAALEMYRSDNGNYPSAGSGSWVEVTAGLTTPLVSTYISDVPADPLSGQSYYYMATNPSGGAYYGFCLSGQLESEDPNDTCTAYTGQNFGLKNP